MLVKGEVLTLRLRMFSFVDRMKRDRRQDTGHAVDSGSSGTLYVVLGVCS